jgi:hypothetical protein
LAISSELGSDVRTSIPYDNVVLMVPWKPSASPNSKAWAEVAKAPTIANAIAVLSPRRLRPRRTKLVLTLLLLLVMCYPLCRYCVTITDVLLMMTA